MKRLNGIENQVIETWLINHRTNLKLMANITESALDYTTSSRGGGTIGHQLAHIYNVRFWRLEAIDKTLIADLSTIKKTDKKTLSNLSKYHTISTQKVQLLFENGLKNNGLFKKSWKRGVIPLLGYFIHHEAHHRGNILLTLKLCGYKMPNDLKYSIWEWSKL